MKKRKKDKTKKICTSGMKKTKERTKRVFDKKHQHWGRVNVGVLIVASKKAFFIQLLFRRFSSH
jgi:hypothetical protein